MSSLSAQLGLAHHLQYCNTCKIQNPNEDILTLLAPGFWILVIQSAWIQFKGSNCCLTLKLCMCFQKYKLTSYEKKKLSKSQKSSEILKFENFMDLIFRHDLTHENGRNSLNFLDKGLIF